MTVYLGLQRGISWFTTRWVCAAIAVICSLAYGNIAFAQTYPTKPITVIVPFGAGTNIDILARQVTPVMSKFLGQPIIVENKAGASAIVGTGAVVSSSPDGYTLLFGAAGTVINPYLFKQIPYDALVDLVPVARVSNQPMVLVVSPTLPVTSVAELIEYGRRNPGKLNYGGTGYGTPVQLAGAYLAHLSGVEMQYVNYNSFGALVPDMVRGELAFMVYPYSAIAGHISSGRLKALATSGDKRAAFLPQLPTLVESGYKVIMPTWQGFFAPAGTPKDVVNTIYAAAAKALADPDLIKRLLETGTEAKPESPEEFDRFIRAQAKLYGEVVSIAKIEPQ